MEKKRNRMQGRKTSVSRREVGGREIKGKKVDKSMLQKAPKGPGERKNAGRLTNKKSKKGGVSNDLIFCSKPTGRKRA